MLFVLNVTKNLLIGLLKKYLFEYFIHFVNSNKKINWFNQHLKHDFVKKNNFYSLFV